MTENETSRFDPALVERVRGLRRQLDRVRRDGGYRIEDPSTGKATVGDRAPDTHAVHVQPR